MWIYVAYGLLTLAVLQGPIAWLVRTDASKHGVGNPDTWLYGILLPVWGILLVPYYWSKRTEALEEE
ncbi:hypothetical protein [Natrarchaeobaculum sulfurireducens]|uniref:Uncharacterized protein n=1 Tax=Natrarchaeobaculum sulfurireducens TaxID=2044521 RepID=A0A346PRB0_9EURY|nr:hypothetical protein [Natrarchaeobaculum sulfurireducens]AXR82055.1 hypothetical protein AArcMg_2055 [Natrarchaeobaculum sulfurireducens]